MADFVVLVSVSIVTYISMCSARERDSGQFRTIMHACPRTSTQRVAYMLVRA